MRISVVVPTRDRPASLRRCLAALAAQDAGELDVVVVDDRSRDRAAVAATLETLAGARLLRARGAGPAAARNLGARAARGDVVLFCDDDCEPRPGWARTLASAASAHEAAAGRTLSAPSAPAPVRAAQLIANVLLETSLDGESGRLGFAPTCNLACLREALARVPFDESFPAAAGEDRDWSARAAAAGAAAFYVPQAVVVHRPALDLRAFFAQQLRYGRGAARFRRAASGGPSRRLAPPGFYAGLLRAGFGHGAAVGGLVIAAQGATALGVALERLSAAKQGLAGKLGRG